MINQRLASSAERVVQHTRAELPQYQKRKRNMLVPSVKDWEKIHRGRRKRIHYDKPQIISNHYNFNCWIGEVHNYYHFSSANYMEVLDLLKKLFRLLKEDTYTVFNHFHDLSRIINKHIPMKKRTILTKQNHCSSWTKDWKLQQLYDLYISNKSLKIGKILENKEITIQKLNPNM